MNSFLAFRELGLTSLGMAILLWSGSGHSEALHFELAHGSEFETATQAQVEKLTAEYDLGPWLFTRHVVIDERAIPHSHPVLTLHTRHLGNPEHLLSTFLHEQIHWLFSGNEEGTASAKQDLRQIREDLPVGHPDGAKTLESSYLHLLVILFEYDSIRHLLGTQTAREVMEFWAGDHYRRLYSIVLEEHEAIRQVAARHGFTCCPPKGPKPSAPDE